MLHRIGLVEGEILNLSNQSLAHRRKDNTQQLHQNNENSGVVALFRSDEISGNTEK